MFDGKGICRRPDVTRLRAFATLPQDDRLVLAIDAHFGISSFAELRAKRPKLHLATAPDDGVNMTGFAAHRLLEASGATPAAI